MQSLFAYEQCKEANYLLADGHIEDTFQPDLNSMELQDKKLLASNRKTARLLFENKFKKADTADNTDAVINKVVKEALDLYLKNTKKDFTFLSKNMVIEVEKLSGYYYAVLGLIVAFAEQGAADKKVNHGHFINNPWVKALEANAELKKELAKGQWGWANKQDKVRPWFRDIIKPDDTYNEFISGKKPDIEEHKNFIKHLYRKLILGGRINEYFEEEDIRWAEDRDIIKGLVDKTIKSLDEKAGKIDIQKVSLDWEDDSAFITNLFTESANLSKDHKKLIAKNTRNWEVDRLALTDRVILEMAIAEMIHFPNIPVKVTINEYIELTKDYSTPKSRQFINGILDVISKELATAGDIKKSGRGLIDNK
jgi:transcription antitermination protein NusB